MRHGGGGAADGGQGSPTMSRSASEPLPPLRGTPVRRLPLRQRAAEMVALGTLIAPSSSGSLQHTHLYRLRRALEAADERAAEVAGGRTGAPDKDWTRERLAQDKAQIRRQPAPQAQDLPQWRLRRGRWVYEGGVTDESADEGLARLREEEEQRGQCQRSENGIARAGNMRRFQKRNPIGNFYT
mmetsp:Transcript_17294/g.49165  ORF Transcript_17294/g.49165 Transcript_17294/m.49165 type:complete len:184 (-) Transcript_17294:7-558(-)